MAESRLTFTDDHDACGVGFIAQLGGPASRAVVERGLEALARLAHRGGVDADGRSGDGAGLLLSIPKAFFVKTAGVRTTTDTQEATIIQTRHRVPETPLSEGQILVYQVPIPEPLRYLEPRETETRTMHALGEYGVMHVKL